MRLKNGLVLIWFIATFSMAEPLTVVYPRDAGRDKENSYDYQLLALALEKSGVPFKLSLSDVEMNEERARRVIAEQSTDVNVMSAGTQKRFEAQLSPIYIPLYGGLVGHRIFIIHKDNLNAFAQVNSLTELRKFVAAQGTSWPDLAVLNKAQLPVQTAEYPTLFRLIEFKRLGYFPRGANEPFEELSRFNLQYPSLVVEPHLLLIYPAAVFFFVSQRNPKLHQVIQQGLEKAHEDGSFLEFFRKHPVTRKMLESANLESRKRFYLENPAMTKQSLSIAEKYWFNTRWQP